MYIFFNNNPKGLRIGDCVIRAISAALSQPWERTYIDLCIEGFMFADLPNSNTVWASYLRSKGFKMPTIRAEIVQINGDEDEANKFPVPTGGTQMMINKTEDKIFIKTVYANNQSNLDVYVKQAPAPPQPHPDFDSFVTREELERRLAELSASATPKKQKEETENEYVPTIR